MSAPRFTPLHDGGGITVGVWTCPGHVPTDEVAVERAGTHEMILPRAGMFARHGRHGVAYGDPTRVLFGNRGDEYRIRHPAGGGDSSTVVLLEEDEAEELLRGGRVTGVDGGAPFAAGSAPAGPDLYRRRWELTSLLRGAGRIDPLAVEELFAELVLAALEACHAVAAGDDLDPDSERLTPDQRTAVERAVAFIHSRQPGPVSLAEVAERAGYSRFHLSRLFRRAMGLPVYRYVNRLRLRDALERLEAADDLSRVAFEHGYASHSHFTGAFREEFGIPPSAARSRAP